MPDTVRTEAELVSLFADNTSAQISAQDARDFIVSADVGKKVVGMHLFASDVSVSTGDGTVGLPISAELNGYEIVDVLAVVYAKGVTGTTDIQIRRRREGSEVDVLSVKVTIGDEFFASDGTINTSNDDVATGDLIFVDVDAVHATPPTGLAVSLSLERA